MSDTRIFVGNLAFQTTPEELRSHLTPAGVITKVQLVTDRVTGRSRGFAFIDFATLPEALKAVAEFDGRDLAGRTLAVTLARPRTDHAPGGTAPAAAEPLPTV